MSAGTWLWNWTRRRILSIGAPIRPLDSGDTYMSKVLTQPSPETAACGRRARSVKWYG
jgi:hypothetical protein